MKVILALVLTVFSLCGCYESKNPISDPNAEKADLSLKGIWRIADEPVFYHIGRASSGGPLGALDVVSIDHTGEKMNRNDYRISPSYISQRKFLNVQDVDRDNGKLGIFVFYEYELRGKRLILKGLEEEYLAAAIISKELEGSAEKSDGKSWDIKLTAPSSAIMAFISSAKGKNLFGGKPITLTKVER